MTNGSKGGGGKTKKPTARQARIAAARVAGKSVSDIAREEGISRGWTSAELHRPETQGLIAKLVDEQSARVRPIFTKALTRIDEALDAMREYSHEGVPFEGGPDHYARLSACTKLIDLLKTGRAPAKAAEEKERRLPTLQEIEAAIAQEAAARQRLV